MTVDNMVNKKKKLTLNIRRDLIDEARRIAFERGESLSSVVEKVS